MKRSEFLKIFGGTMFATQLPNLLHANNLATANQASAALRGEVIPDIKLDIHPLTIDVGATKPFSALHISDSHLTRVFANEMERKRDLSKHRQKIFPWAEHYFDAHIRYAADNDMIILHTGDLIDFVSEANLSFIKGQLSVGDWFASAGNHEYSQFVGEAKEDAAYKAQSFDKVQAAYPNNLSLASHVVNGVNFVAIDDVYYNFTEQQHELMEREVKRGLPIVMLCHVPLYTPKHCEYGLKQTKGLAAYLTGAPLEITSKYKEYPNLAPDQRWRNRSIQQRADKPTLDFIAWLKEQPELKAILCGHCHYFFEERFSPTAIQYTVGAGYKGAAYAINFK